MKRADLLSNARTGQVLLVSSNTFLSKAIQWFQGCKYSHAALVLIIDNKPYVVEAIKHGVATTPLVEYVNDKAETLGLLKPNFVITVDQEKDIISTSLSLAGHEGYGFGNLIGLQSLRYAWLKLFGTETTIDYLIDKTNSGKRPICAELCAIILNKVEPGLFPEWKQIAPADLYSSKNFTFEVIV